MALKLNLNTRDLEFGNSMHLKIANKTEDVQQRLILKTELMKGEWFLDKNEGIPWKEIFSETGEDQVKMAKTAIRDMLNNDKGVSEIKELNVYQDLTKNSLNINFKVIATDENEYTIEVSKRG
jgi:hypothetical protein